MKRIFIVLILLAAFPVFAGEKEDLQKDVSIYQLQLQNIELQTKVMIYQQTNYYQIEAKLKDATEKLKLLEDKDKKPVAKEQIKK
jgi:hypothetical protein